MQVTKATIKKWNEYFKSLSPSEKRIAIAKDVLFQLKKGRYSASAGNYVSFHQRHENNEDVQSNFNGIRCEVCAVGSAVMSCIKFTNDATFHQVKWDDEKVYEKLTKYFSKKQLCLMEYAFEGFTEQHGKANDWNIAITPSERSKTLAFYEKYFDTDLRLKAIWNNVINNKGVFKL